MGQALRYERTRLTSRRERDTTAAGIKRCGAIRCREREVREAEQVAVHGRWAIVQTAARAGSVGKGTVGVDALTGRGAVVSAPSATAAS